MAIKLTPRADRVQQEPAVLRMQVMIDRCAAVTRSGYQCSNLKYPEAPYGGAYTYVEDEFVWLCWFHKREHDAGCHPDRVH